MTEKKSTSVDTFNSTQKLYADHSLNHRKDEIRLFHLNCEPWESGLKGNFTVVDLDEEPSYIAISYTWGEVLASSEISIDDQSFVVTESLYSALKRLRWHAYIQRIPPIAIWADALCINQHDQREKEYQIPLMRRIYSQALFTAVWLGDMSTIDLIKASEACEGLILDLAKGYHLMQLDTFTCDDEHPQLWSIHEVIHRLCLHKYHTRRWVMQEQFLAQSMLVFFGAAIVERNDMKSALYNLNDHITSCCCRVEQPWKKSLQERLRWLLVSLNGIEYLMLSPGGKRHIFDLCFTLRLRKTTKSIDCVYSLLGMTNPPSKIAPDYSRSLCGLFTEIAADYVNKVRALDFLPEAGNCQGLDGLPSWAINWAIFPNTWSNLLHEFQPTTNMRQETRVESEKWLHLKAYILDQIEETLYLLSVAGPEPEYADQVIDNFGAFLANKDDLDQEHPYGGSWREAWCRTFLSDHSQDLTYLFRLNTDQVALFLYMISKVSEDGCTTAQLAQANQAAATHFENLNQMASKLYKDRKAFFYTKRGHIGLASHHVQAGDHVYFVPTCGLPMIMREAPENAGTSRYTGQNVVQVVSGCYLHGCMDGQIRISEEQLDDYVVI